MRIKNQRNQLRAIQQLDKVLYSIGDIVNNAMLFSVALFFIGEING